MMKLSALGIPGEYSAAMLTLFFLEKIILVCKLQTIDFEEFSSYYPTYSRFLVCFAYK